MAWTFEKVTSAVVVLGEGRDEAELLGVLAKRLGLEIQCVDCGGSQQFPLDHPALSELYSFLELIGR